MPPLSIVGLFSAGSRRPWRSVVTFAYRCALALLVLGTVVLSLRAVWFFTIDDAGISYAYAKHLAEWRGPVAVVGGPRIEGYSNPLWVFLLVPVHWLSLPIPEAAKLLGALFFAVQLLAGAGVLLLVEGRSWRRLGALEAGFALTTSLCLEVVVWVPAGLENALFSALLLTMVVLDAREARHGEAVGFSGLCAFLLSITRPEAVLYAAALPLIKLIRAFGKREPMRQAVTASLLFIGPLLVYHAGHYLAFGELVPNTYYAKPGGREWTRGFDYLSDATRESGLIYVLPLALVGLLGDFRLKLLLGWAWISGTVFVLYSGGDWMPHGRFLSLFAPVVLLLAALGLRRLTLLVARFLPNRLPREVAALGLASVAVVGWGLFQVPRLRALRQRSWCHFCERVADTQRLQRLSARAGLASSSLVTHDFGGPSWLSDESFYPLDFLGLCDRSIVLIRGTRARGGVRDEFRFYQYLIHEQPLAPSWILVPPNFWPGFDRSPEFVFDFYALDPRLLPRARRDSFFVLHRGELVDYFPPTQSTPFQPLTDQLTLGGWSVFAAATTSAGDRDRVGPGSQLELLVTLLPRGSVRGTEEISLRVTAGAETRNSPAQRLDRGLGGIARQLKKGEPLSFEFSLTLPSAAVASYPLSLAVRSRAAAQGAAATTPIVVPIGEIAAGTSLSHFERVLPRYPSALPAPVDPELRALRQPVTNRVERSRRQGRAAPADETLSNQLSSIGDRLDAQGHADQAYLAYVWATQVNRSAWGRLAETVHRLRQTSTSDEHALEVALLQRFYADGEATELARLVAFYVAGGRLLEAEYFLRRWPETSAGDEPALALRNSLNVALEGRAASGESGTRDLLAEVAHDPFEGAFDFESESLELWQGDVASFRAGPDRDGRDSKGVRGRHGNGVLSSKAGGEQSRGSLSSPEFHIDGQLMSVLVGGGSAKRKVGVQLIVEGRVAFTAAGNDSDNLLPVFWDVASFQGKPARLRIFDESTRSHVLMDRVLLWR